IDVLPVARNFRQSQSIPASRGEQMTLLKRVPDQDPKWWPHGVAIEIISINGREQTPPKIAYVAKVWFERGTRLGEVAQVPDPVQLQTQVITALTPVLPACEVEVPEETPMVVLEQPRRPAQIDTYSVLSELVK